jgi:hypothetical protein
MSDSYKRREQGTGNREQIRNTHLHQFNAQSKKRCFYKMRSMKKTVSLFQSQFPISSELATGSRGYTDKTHLRGLRGLIVG